jgi:hypothetical protein
MRLASDFCAVVEKLHCTHCEIVCLSRNNSKRRIGREEEESEK